MRRPLKLLVDCNVWIDSYMALHRHHEESLRFVNEALNAGCELLYGASKLETTFYVIHADAKRVIRADKGEVNEFDAEFALRFAWACVENMEEIATAVAVDASDLWLARKYRRFHKDLEDNVLLASAHRSEADYVVTWDEALLRDASALVRAVTPTTMLTVLQSDDEE